MSFVLEYTARSAYFDIYARAINLVNYRFHAYLTSAEFGESSISIPDNVSEMSTGSNPDSAPGKPIENGQIKIQAAGAEDQSAVLKFFGGVLTAAKERMLGDTWWLTKDATEILEIPAKYLAANHLELERKDQFVLLKGSYTASAASVLYHVAIVWKKDGKMYSIWRNEKLADTREFIRSVAPFAILLKYIDNVKDVKMLLTKICEHPLWKPVHIAARLDLQGFFQDAQMDGTLPALLQQCCQPEGRFPIHLVVKYNYVELAKKLFSYGASLAQTDSKGYTALHYGASTSPAMLELLCSHPEAKQCINALSSDGYTPLFLAVKSCRPTCVAALMNREAVLNIRCQGRSALHEAMLQNSATVVDVIQTLVQACPASITERDPVTGNSLLHSATNKKSVAALIAIAPTIDRNVKNKVGQTALHWHVQRDDLGMVVALFIAGIDMDAKDNDGNTSLHLAVSRGNLEIVKALLVFGSNVNVVNATGDSPFHMAVRMKHKDKFDIIQCLITCGAQQCPQEKQGCTVQCAYRPSGIPPRPPPPYSTLTDVVPTYIDNTVHTDKHLIPSISDPTLIKKDPVAENPNDGSPKKEVSVRTGASAFSSTTGALSHLDQFMQKKCIENIESQCQQTDKDGKKPKFEVILSLDGGGIRGLVLVQTLLALERELGEPILKYVDWLAGTSTGSYLATGLAKGKSLRECQQMYLSFKDEIFDGWVRPYSAEVLEKFIIILTGAQTTMADIKEPKMVITTTAADKIPIKLHLFRNYCLPVSDEENLASGYLDPKDQLLWKALRCSSAAPTYFSSVENKFVDGGLAANNPTVEVLAEIQRYNNALEYSGKTEEKLRVGCAISIGTGLMPDVPAESLNFTALESMSAIRTLGLMLIEQACATEGGPVERARAWLQGMGAPFFRLNPLLSKEYFLDTKEDKELVAMMWEVEEFVRQKSGELKELVKFLKIVKG